MPYIYTNTDTDTDINTHKLHLPRFDAIHRPAPWKKSTENLDPTRSNQARGMTQQETAKAKKWSIPRRKINSQREDIQGLEKTVAFVNRLIAKKIAQGIPADRIIVGGFSQGMMALV